MPFGTEISCREGFGDRAGNREVVEAFQDIEVRCVEAHFMVWETGPWSELRGSGNRICGGAHLEGNFERRGVSGPARRSGNRASWVVSRQTHHPGNWVMGWWTRRAHSSSQAVSERVERQTRGVGNRVARAWTRRNGFCGALQNRRRRENKLIVWATMG